MKKPSFFICHSIMSKRIQSNLSYIPTKWLGFYVAKVPPPPLFPIAVPKVSSCQSRTDLWDCKYLQVPSVH